MAKEATTPPDDFASSLDAPRPEAFIFKKEGDKLVGTVEDINMDGYDPEYRNDSYPIVVIRDESDGSLRSVHCFHATMLSGMEKADPQIGERIGIVYMGEREPKGSGKPYKDFRVKIDRKTTRQSFSEVVLRATDPTPKPEPELEPEPEPETDEDGLPF